MMLCEKQQQKENTQRLDKKQTNTDSIFVVFPVYRNVESHLLLNRMFEAAQDPSRVHVGLLEYNPSSPTTELYTRLLKRGNYLPSIKSRRVTDSRFIFGGSMARQVIVDEFYNGEKFVLFVHGHSWFLDGWDNILIDSLLKLPSPRAVLSLFPLDAGVHLSRAPSTFPVFSGFSHDNSVPIFSGQSYTNRVVPPYRCGVASYKCLFGPATVLLRDLKLHDPGIPYLRSHEADYILSVQLWSFGYEIYNPSESPLLHVAPQHHSYDDVSAKSLNKIRTLIVKYFTLCSSVTTKYNHDLLFIDNFNTRRHGLNSPADFQKWFGVDTVSRNVAGRLYAGLLEQYTDAELVHKFGSLSTFNMLKAEFFS